MARTIKLSKERFEQLLKTGETDLGLASRTIHLLDNSELFMNYEGTDYTPTEVIITFEEV